MQGWILSEKNIDLMSESLCNRRILRWLIRNRNLILLWSGRSSTLPRILISVTVFLKWASCVLCIVDAAVSRAWRTCCLLPTTRIRWTSESEIRDWSRHLRTICASSTILIMGSCSAEWWHISASRPRRTASATVRCTTSKPADGPLRPRISTATGALSVCSDSIRRWRTRSLR